MKNFNLNETQTVWGTLSNLSSASPGTYSNKALHSLYGHSIEKRNGFPGLQCKAHIPEIKSSEHNGLALLSNTSCLFMLNRGKGLKVAFDWITILHHVWALLTKKNTPESNHGKSKTEVPSPTQRRREGMPKHNLNQAIVLQLRRGLLNQQLQLANSPDPWPCSQSVLGPHWHPQWVPPEWFYPLPQWTLCEPFKEEKIKHQHETIQEVSVLQQQQMEFSPARFQDIPCIPPLIF